MLRQPGVLVINRAVLGGNLVFSWVKFVEPVVVNAFRGYEEILHIQE